MNSAYFGGGFGAGSNHTSSNNSSSSSVVQCIAACNRHVSGQPFIRHGESQNDIEKVLCSINMRQSKGGARCKLPHMRLHRGAKPEGGTVKTMLAVLDRRTAFIAL